MWQINIIVIKIAKLFVKFLRIKISKRNIRNIAINLI